uniref:Uncharacterized protein n=1 Tax=Canis lupus familiaris TaxID=9615 RepID=A0A8C0S701_CANLF
MSVSQILHRPSVRGRLYRSFVARPPCSFPPFSFSNAYLPGSGWSPWQRPRTIRSPGPGAGGAGTRGRAGETGPDGRGGGGGGGAGAGRQLRGRGARADAERGVESAAGRAGAAPSAADPGALHLGTPRPGEQAGWGVAERA